MSYSDIVSKHLNEILSDIRKEIKNDETVFEFIKDEKELDELLSLQEELVKKYLQNYEMDTINEKKCKEFYKDLKIPFTLIHRSLNSLKNEILKFMEKDGMDKLKIYDFSLYFQRFIDLTAKVYLKKDIYALRKIVNSPFNRYLLFRAHVSWVYQIVKSVQNDKMECFPLIDAKECKFNEDLYYPESLMVCMDKNLCMYINDLHVLIHKIANSFFVFYEKGKYAEAYFLFKDLKEQVLKFSKLLSELYFMTFSNLESSFFKLLELYQMDKELFVSMIDIKNLKSFNTIYGELVITKALKKLEKKLEKFISKDKKRVLIIKGITSDFYVLNVDYTKEEYERFLDKIRALVSEVIEIDNLKIEFLSTLVGIKIDKYSDYREYEFVKILTFLNNRAKKAKKNVFTVFDESNNSLFASILNEKYNEKFLLSKIKSKEIDIVFQPIFKSDGKKYFTLEVLGRIKDDEKLLPAGMFIDKIYEMNLIEKFDMLILEKLIEKKEFIKKISDSVFVNVSFQSLLNEEYMYKLKELLENKDLNVILELTEQKFVENLELVKEIHKKYGVFFAVDDFGSGYSSLQTVIELVKEKVLKILKIDGSLIRNVQNDEYMKKIVKIISRLGNELELKTVAEFVENEETFNLLKDIRIDLFQGYFLCMPKSLEELLAVKAGALEF